MIAQTAMRYVEIVLDPSAFLDWLIALNKQANALVWGPPMLVLLVGTGIYITIRTRFIQFRKFGLMSRETLGRIFRRGPAAEGDVTPFQAMSVAMGGTVGVGNIAGVATAIAAGGPGAVFWMLVSGLVGMATKFAEVVLGVHYRRRDPGGPMMGGPMTYITRGLGPRWKWLAIVFCIFGALAALGIGNMTQAQAVADGVEQLLQGEPARSQPQTRPTSRPRTRPATQPQTKPAAGAARAATFPASAAATQPATAPAPRSKVLSIARWVVGGVLIVAVGLVTIGGIKRIAHVAMFCVPFMCILYMVTALAVIALHTWRIPAVLWLVVKHAFTPTAAAGGFAGVGVMMAIRYGIARGVFSNEAGLGSAPMAHATAQTDHPARQGLWGIFEVFFDTIVMCTATALVILLTGAWRTGLTGAKLTIDAFSRPLGGTTGAFLVTSCMILTAYDTILAWCFYGETCCAFVLGHGRTVRTLYRLVWLPFILVGALGQLEVIWAVADTLNGLMAIPNLIALIVLAGVVVKLARGFLAGRPYQPPAERAPP